MALCAVLFPGGAKAQNIVVDAAPSHAVNSFSPPRALGGAIDRLRGGATTRGQREEHANGCSPVPVLKEMLGAGWGTVTYRQNTELMIEAWHWNPRGTWSNAAKQEGYFTGSAEPTDEKILHSWAYPLPHRGATMGDGNGWSRLTDGDPKSYWKSNPYLTKAYHRRGRLAASAVGHDRPGRQGGRQCHPDRLGRPYAKRYYVQFWTGEQEPFYDGINKGAWQTFPMGTHRRRQRRDSHAEADELDHPRAIPPHLDDGILQHLRYPRRRRTSATAWDTRSTNSMSGLCRRMASSLMSSSICRAGSRPSPGRLRWTHGTPHPTWTTAAATRSASTSSSTAA